MPNVPSVMDGRAPRRVDVSKIPRAAIRSRDIAGAEIGIVRLCSRRRDARQRQRRRQEHRGDRQLERRLALDAAAVRDRHIMDSPHINPPLLRRIDIGLCGGTGNARNTEQTVRRGERMRKRLRQVSRPIIASILRSTALNDRTPPGFSALARRIA